MAQETYQSVLNRLSKEVPLFGKQILDTALRKVGTNRQNVSPYELKKAIDKYVEPALRKKLGIHKGLAELGTDYVILANNKKPVYFSQAASQMYHRIKKHVKIDQDLRADIFTLKDKRIKVITIPLTGMQSYGAAVLMSDITLDLDMEHQIAETYNQLSTSEKRFADLVNISADWIWETDSVGKIIFSSGRVKELLGYDIKQIINKRIWTFIDNDRERKRLKKSFRAIENINTECEALGNNTRRLILTINAVPLVSEKSRLLGFRGVCRDITEIRKAHQALVERNDELERFNRLAIGRELQMMKLKKRIKSLEKSIGVTK